MKRKPIQATMLVVALIAMIIYGCKKEDNSPPSIQSISSTPSTSSNNRLPAGDQATITVTATDPDKDNLSYYWQANGGSFLETNNASVIWESPVSSSDKTYKITAFVSDGAATSIIDISMYIGGVTLCNLKGYAYYSNTKIPVLRET